MKFSSKLAMMFGGAALAASSAPAQDVFTNSQISTGNTIVETPTGDVTVAPDGRANRRNKDGRGRYFGSSADEGGAVMDPMNPNAPLYNLQERGYGAVVGALSGSKIGRIFEPLARPLSGNYARTNSQIARDLDTNYASQVARGESTEQTRYNMARQQRGQVDYILRGVRDTGQNAFGALTKHKTNVVGRALDKIFD